MTLANRFNSLLHACVILAVMAFVAADDKALLGIIAAIAIGASWLFSRGRRVNAPPALPRNGINILVLAAIVNAAFRATGNQLDDPFVSTLGQFLVFIVLIKMLDRRAPRDDAQLITLSIFIAIAAVLTSNTFIVGVLLIAYVPTTVAAAMMWQLRAGQVLMAQSPRDDEPPLAASLAPFQGAKSQDVRLPSGLHPRRGFLALCFSSVIASSLIATLIFVVLPRGLGSEFLGRFGMAHEARIGFRETVSLGQSGFLSDNQTPVLDMQISSPTGEVIGGPGEPYYLRGGVRDQYVSADSVWQDSVSTHGSANHPTTKVKKDNLWTPKMRGDLSPPPLAGSGATGSLHRIQKITMRADSAGGNMFCLWRPVSITLDRDAEIAFSSRFGTLRHPNSVGSHFTYTVDSMLTDQLTVAPPDPDGFQKGRIREFTDLLMKQRGIGRDKHDRPVRQIISIIRDHLRTKYQYTLEMVAPPEGVDPIEFFLFDRQKGHCEYFASAMAAMCQSQGIPCRVVTGYLATEFNGLTGQYIVRESSAHAWVEAFITVDPETGRGRWEQFDPSPQAEIERIHRPPAGLFAQLRNWYDALEFGWSTSVVGFDNATDRRERSADGRAPPDEAAYARPLTRAADQLVSWLKTVRRDRSLIPLFLRWLPVLGVALVLILVGVRRARMGFRSANLSSKTRSAYGLSSFKPRGFYGRALKSLARAGTPKPDSTPPARFAETLGKRSPVAAAHLRTLTHMYYQSRFGARTLSPADIAAGELEARRLDEALKLMRTAAAAAKQRAGAPIV